MASIPLGIFTCFRFPAQSIFSYYLTILSQYLHYGVRLKTQAIGDSVHVHEMWESSKVRDRHFSIGHFCFFASEMKHSHEKRSQRLQPLSKRTRDKRTCMKKRAESTEAVYEVFLGGSCNPTTWRRDVAIPELKKQSITYYNPQVSCWGPELIELENQAKENAKVMFFVIDNQTRSIASMIEAAHVAGTRRKLILVINELEGPGSVVLGEKITEKEYLDLKKGREYLQDIVQSQGIPVYSKLQEALEAAARVVKEDIRPEDVPPKSSHTSVIKVPHVSLGDKYFKLREVFEGYDSTNSGKISLDDVQMAFKVLTGRELSRECLTLLITNQQGPLLENGKVQRNSLQECSVTFEQFCCIVSEYKHQTKNGNKLYSLVNSVLQPFFKIYDWMLPKSHLSACSEKNEIIFASQYRNVYLGGSRMCCNWRQEIAIPALKKNGLTYYTPLENPWNERFVPLETTVIDCSKVLLFVVTKTTRSLAEMIVAAHYVGQMCDVVLCIQYLEEDVIIDGEKLSSQAVKDYNRGRMYLSDLATRAGVPVYSDIEEAVNCVVSKCQ